MLSVYNRAWMSKGKCFVSSTPDDWHAERDDNREAYARAKTVCYSCPVRAACLEFAQAAREPDGIWGGMDPDERFEARKRLLRSMSRQRVLI
jgi:WhiB family transcriptional regulator, redox-sensing transcriptional regulator